MAKSREKADVPEIRSKNASAETAPRVSPEADLACAGVTLSFPASELWYVLGNRGFSWISIAASLRDCISREDVQQQTGRLRLEVSYPAGTPELSDLERAAIEEDFIPSIVASLREGRQQFAIAFEASQRMRICAYFRDFVGSLQKSAHVSMAVGHGLVGLDDKVLRRVLDIPVESRHIDTVTPVGRGQLLPLVSPPLQESAMDDFCSLLNQFSLDDVSEVLRLLDGFDGQVVQALVPVKERLEMLFKRLEGRAFGSLEANKAVTARIRDLLNRIGYRVECLRDGCHEPAFLLCQGPSSMPEGAFQFQHRYNGRLTAHCGFPKIPPLKLVPQPEDNRRKVRRRKTL